MRVFIAYSNLDLQVASAFSSALRELGFEVVRAETFLEPGDDIERRIKEELQRSDALVILWSKNALNSGSLIMELGFFLGASGSKPLVPVILDDSKPPLNLMDRVALFGANQPPKSLATQVAAALHTIAGTEARERERAKARKQEVERSAELYIEQSLAALSARESRYSRLGMTCYALGYVTLICGLAYAVSKLVQDPPVFSDTAQSMYVGVLTITAIGFLAAVSKFAFVLGRSFTVEALRNNDRIHAIKFGEFYLKGYGEQASWMELKEAFQHWNLDSGSLFKEQDENSIDPQVLRTLRELIRSLRK